jgi:predicted lipoprotein with Yx(FWY)xxD motif
MKRPLIALASALAVLAAALLAAGCGGSANASGSTSASTSSGSSAGSSGGYGYGHRSSSSTPSTSTQASSGAATIAVRTTPIGRILVDGRGMTLYLFEKDTGMKSTCNDSCAKFWPPVTTKGAAKAGSGLDAGELGTTARTDGTTEVTYNGHPLYYLSYPRTL